MTADGDLAGLPNWARGMIGYLAAHPAAPDEPHVAEYREDCRCRECQLNVLVLAYMFLAMEPTDRALRPAEPRD